jgi:hypothetical protein
VEDLREIKETVRILVSDVSTLKTQVALTMQGQEQHQERVREFIARNEIESHSQTIKLDQLIRESGEWKGARKLFNLAWAGVLGVAAIVGVWAAWIGAHAKGL